MSSAFGTRNQTMLEDMLDHEAIWDAYSIDDSTAIGDQPPPSLPAPLRPFVHSQPESWPVPSQPESWPVPIDNLDFLKLSPGNASLTIILPDEVTVTISDLDPGVISQQCPLLAVSFESGLSGEPKASIEVPSLIVAICFLRYCYTSSYMPNWDSVDDNSTCALLIHAQLCHIGEIFDVPALQAMAHFNVIRQTELSCCRPTPPADLVPTIRYIFDNLSSQKGLIDTVINYCVNCFHYHRLGQNNEFRKMSYELQEFTRELSRVNMERDFADDGASEIIQLPCIPTEHSEAAFNRKVLGDFVFEIFSSEPSANLYAPPSPPSSNPPSTASTPHLAPQNATSSSSTADTNATTASLPLRPKSAYLLVPRDRSVSPGHSSAEEESSSEDEEAAFAGFTLVRRPRDDADTYVEPTSGRRFAAYDDSDTETLTGKEHEHGQREELLHQEEEEPVLVPADVGAESGPESGADSEIVVVESVRREAERREVRRSGEVAAAVACPRASTAHVGAEEERRAREATVDSDVDGDWDMIF